MKNSKTAPWHGAARKSSLGHKFRKRNAERFRVIKAINERRDRSERRRDQYGTRDVYTDAE